MVLCIRVDSRRLETLIFHHHLISLIAIEPLLSSPVNSQRRKDHRLNFYLFARKLDIILIESISRHEMGNQFEYIRNTYQNKCKNAKPSHNSSTKNWRQASKSHPLPNLTLPFPRLLETIGRTLKIEHGLIDILLARQDKLAILDNRLIQRPPSNEQKAGLLLRVFRDRSLNEITLLLEDDIVELRHGTGRIAGPEYRSSGEDVRECIPV